MKGYSDPLHGFVDLEPVEQQVVNTDWFRRLQNVRQLGVVPFVFPSATHTRFAHSLGVMNYAGKMSDALKTDRGARALTTEERQIVRLAGLLHDVGHAPFSHNLEHAFEREFERARKENFERTPFDDHSLFQGVELDWSEEKPYDHETIGSVIIQKSDIGRVLQSAGMLDKVRGLLRGKAQRPVMSHIISSSLDADKMDYLQRDSWSIGAGYGQVDAPKLIRELHIQDDALALREDGMGAFQHFLLARYHWYSSIIAYHRISCLEELLNKACAEFSQAKLDDQHILPNLEEYLTAIQTTLENRKNRLNFFQFDDTYVTARLSEARIRFAELAFAPGQEARKEGLKELLSALVRGEPYPLVCRHDVMATTENAAEKLKPFEDTWEVICEEFRDAVAQHLIIRADKRVDVVKDDQQPAITMEAATLVEAETDLDALNHPVGVFKGIDELTFHARRIHAVPALAEAVRRRAREVASSSR